MGEVAIWDGLEIKVVGQEEADKLVAEDKAEIMDGSALRYRGEFTGYHTRELRAGTPPTPVVSTPDKVPAGEVNNDESLAGFDQVDAGDEAALDWHDYKDAYKEATGKKRATKDQVEEWMRNEGII